MFYVVGKGWVAAGDLTAGDKLCLESGKTVTVTGSELEKLDKPIKVYNLEVLDNHTYFVGDKAVLVHNDYGGNNNNGSNNTGGSGFDDAFAADNYTLTDDTYNSHILPRHGSNSTYSNKCHFDANFDIKAEIDKLLKGDDFI